MQMSTGGQSPVIKAGGDVSVTYGLNEERVKAMLEQQQEQLFRKLRESSFAANKQERQLLEQQLQAVSAKLADIEKSYEEELARREAADAALDKMRGYLLDEQIKKAKTNLEQGYIEEAEKIFDTVAEGEVGPVAIAAYHSGQLAEERQDYYKAMRQYTKAVEREQDNPDYLLAAGEMARTIAEYNQAEAFAGY